MKPLIIATILMLMLGIVSAADFSVYEANYPGVKDYNVNLDQAVLTIQPRGAYIEMNLELTVSYDFESWFFKNYNELEFLWQFSLPDQASVTDFWIWMADTVLQATMLDRWTAELLFSEVSSPVRNPALLTQSFPDREGQVHYSLRLYPIMRDEKRKFKIQYLLPARPTNKTLRAWLPTSQLTSRRSPGVDSLHIVFMNEQQPTLIGVEILSETFKPEKPAWEYDVLLDFDRFVELVYPTPIDSKSFFSTFEENEETFYQLAVYPPEVEEERIARNFVILVDFNRYNTQEMDGELVLLLLKETMQQALTAQDSANIIVAFENLVFGADKFMACDEHNLDVIFEKILMRSFPAYSSFQVLIAAAVEFLQNHPTPAEVILLTNTDEINLYGYTREEYADEIIAMFPQNTKLHIVDLENFSRLVYNHEQSQYETQLQSFYGHICNKTGGNLFFLRYHSIKNILAALFYERISHFQEVEVQTRFASGYAYGKHLIALHQGYYPLHFPIMQVGRFRGSLPLEVTVLGKVRLEKAIDTFTITDADVIPGNEKLATAWYSDHIHGLLKQAQVNATIMEIMDISLAHRILTPYTGYLVFRPGENHGYEPPDISSIDDGRNDGEWGDQPTDVDSSKTNQPQDFALELQAYPNPFNLAVTISISIPALTDASKLEFGIFNTLGQKVKNFEIEVSPNTREIKLLWDGKSDAGDIISTGLYFAVLYGSDFRKSLKIVLVK